MPTPLYRFHCTDGFSLVADLTGKRLPTLALVRHHAERIAIDLMRRGGEWSDWYVHVYDERGRAVMEKAFGDIQPSHLRAEAYVVRSDR